MIRVVTIKGFKRFADVRFDIPGHVVLAGPNNTGKTTLLQAIAVWELALRKWREIGDYNSRRNGFQWQDLERLAFSAVAVRTFELLWTDRNRASPFEIGVQVDGLPCVTFEFHFQADGLMRARPRADVGVGAALQDPRLQLRTTFIPAMSGLAREERQFADPEAIDDLLAQGRPGEVLRNLLVIAHRNDEAWRNLNDTIGRLFESELLPPQTGAVLVCEYRRRNDAESPRLDIASAGSGFLQVLLLLTLLLTQQRNAVAGTLILLIDEPDAHLHMILQRSIYGELRAVAVTRQAQLFLATHSEMIVNQVDARELYLMYGIPRVIDSNLERARLTESFGALTHSDILEAEGARGVLYIEDFTDLDILSAFARVLGDEDALKLLTRELLGKSSKAPLPDGLGEFTPQKHWDMLKLIQPEIRALEILDGDNQRNKAPDLITGSSAGMQRLRWRRYEIESYLILLAPLQRFIESRLGGAAAAALAVVDLKATLTFLDGKNESDPLVQTYFESKPVSKTLLPDLINAAGINAPKRDYFEIAGHFTKEEVHPEIVERLNQIKQAFGITDV